MAGVRSRTAPCIQVRRDTAAICKVVTLPRAVRHPRCAHTLATSRGGISRRLLSALLRDMVPRSAPAASTQGRSFMLDRFFLLLSAFAVLAAAGGGEARAHPHVWVTMKSELIYSADGALTGVRQAWTFDDMFSTFATQGIESKVKGAFTREELAPLAEVNVSSLKEFDYFTYARVNGKKTPFGDPTYYWLDFTNGVLTLHFTLPLKAPVKAQNLELAVYDPTVFVDFTF